jgi:hypothetical protein
MQVAEIPDKETQGDKRPEAAMQLASSRVPAIAVSLAALAVIGAATANFLPNFDRVSLPDFSFSLPDFSRFSLPNFSRVAAQPPQKTAPAPIPDPVVRAALKDVQLSQKDIQSSQQETAAVLVSLTQSSATQQADLKRISRQLTLLSVQADSLRNSLQVDALRNTVMPLTTASIPHSNPRARVIRASRKVTPPLPPKPVGPVSVGGAPLGPAPASGSGAS